MLTWLIVRKKIGKWLMRCSFLSLPCYCRHAACRLLLLLCPPATNKGGSPRQKVLGPAQMYVSVNGGWVGEWVGVWAAGRARMGGWVVRRRVYLEWLSNYNVSGEMCLPRWLFVGKKFIFLPVIYGLSFKSMLFTLYLHNISDMATAYCHTLRVWIFKSFVWCQAHWFFT